MKKAGWVGLFLVALVAAPYAHAHDQGEGGGKGRMGKGLDLTRDQQTKMKAISDEQMKTQKPLWEQLGTQMKELKALVDKKAPDADLTAKMGQIKATHDQIEVNRKSFEQQKAQILTPLQQAKMTLWMGMQARKGMDHWKGKGGQDPKDNTSGKDDDDD